MSTSFRDGSNTDSLSVSRPSRRWFLFTSAAAVAGLAVWRPALAMSSGDVTIIEFSEAGKPTGKAAIPKLVRPDAEWKQKLTPVSYDVTPPCRD